MKDEPPPCEFMLEVLRLMAETDCYDLIWWRCDGEYAPVTFLVNCNDLFHWATADCEKLTIENFPILQQSISDVSKAMDNNYTYSEWGYLLFCARVRKMRPQQPAYPKDERLRALFDIAGPPRDRASEG